MDKSTQVYQPDKHVKIHLVISVEQGLEKRTGRYGYHIPRYIYRTTTGFAKSGGNGGAHMDLFGMYQPDHPWLPNRYTI